MGSGVNEAATASAPGQSPAIQGSRVRSPGWHLSHFQTALSEDRAEKARGSEAEREVMRDTKETAKSMRSQEPQNPRGMPPSDSRGHATLRCQLSILAALGTSRSTQHCGNLCVLHTLLHQVPVPLCPPFSAPAHLSLL